MKKLMMVLVAFGLLIAAVLSLTRTTGSQLPQDPFSPEEFDSLFAFYQSQKQECVGGLVKAGVANLSAPIANNRYQCVPLTDGRAVVLNTASGIYSLIDSHGSLISIRDAHTDFEFYFEITAWDEARSLRKQGLSLDQIKQLTITRYARSAARVMSY